jgi:hypothetical protein
MKRVAAGLLLLTAITLAMIFSPASADGWCASAGAGPVDTGLLQEPYATAYAQLPAAAQDEVDDAVAGPAECERGSGFFVCIPPEPPKCVQEQQPPG